MHHIFTFMSTLLLPLIVAIALPWQASDTNKTHAIQEHLLHVESSLRSNQPQALSASQSLKRQQALDELQRYRQEGRFPHNTTRSYTTPIFLDQKGRPCAMAHLIIASGHEKLAHDLAAKDNHAYVLQVEDPELDRWLHDHGLRPEEAAWIQPMYESKPESIFLYYIFCWLFMVIPFAIFAHHKQQKSWEEDLDLEEEITPVSSDGQEDILTKKQKMILGLLLSPAVVGVMTVMTQNSFTIPPASLLFPFLPGTCFVLAIKHYVTPHQSTSPFNLFGYLSVMWCIAFFVALVF